MVTNFGPEIETFISSAAVHICICTPYHPQSNGIVERFNDSIIIQISKLHQQYHNNWDAYLDAVVFAYNTSQHKTTKLDPRYSADPQIIVDLYHPTYTVRNLTTGTERSYHVSDLCPILVDVDFLHIMAGWCCWYSSCLVCLSYHSNKFCFMDVGATSLIFFLLLTGLRSWFCGTCNVCQVCPHCECHENLNNCNCQCLTQQNFHAYYLQWYSHLGTSYVDRLDGNRSLVHNVNHVFHLDTKTQLMLTLTTALQSAPKPLTSSQSGLIIR
ncbi:unnamed protein product [Adineta ricciae]|uniref:Integrase catalytic domain-containing protein n=1 Tax=Adineta ricciae TaxID=249248 RepID=A0A815J520_ADIRI|nr:unnamed protein product [Adineta ricciae]